MVGFRKNGYQVLIGGDMGFFECCITKSCLRYDVIVVFHDGYELL